MSDAYSRLLYIADKTRSKAVIENDSVNDSAEVFSRFFQSAESSIFILARGVKEQVLSQSKVLESSSEFLNSENRKLELVLRAKNEQDLEKSMGSKFVRSIRRAANNNLEIKFYIGDDSWLNDVGSTTTADGRMYRYRHKQDDYTSNSNADVCFNDPQKCIELTNRIKRAVSELELFTEYTY